MNQQKKGGRSKSHGRISRDGGSSNYLRNIGDILPSMIAYINTFESGFTSIKNLQERFYNFSTDEIWSFVLNNPINFVIEPHNRNKIGKNQTGIVPVWVKTDLHLCEKHCRKGKICTGVCGKLHLCRNFLLLGDMCCPFHKAGKACAFGHKFDTQHNGNLLTSHKLRNLSEQELRILFRRRVCRSVSTMPQICIYYNGKGGKGCSNTQCKALHLCLDFVKERCHGLCRKNHSMSSKQVAFILDLFAIDTSWPNDAVLEDLRSIMQKRISASNDDDIASIFSTDSNDLDDDDKSETGLKDFAGVDDVEANHDTKQCCSHCEELRSDMDKMMEKMKKLEGQLQNFQFQAPVAKTSTSVTGQAEGITKQLQNTDDNCQSAPEQVSQAHKKMLGEELYPLVKELQPNDAEKITGMLLELGYSEILHILSSPTMRKQKVEEAVAIMKAFLKQSHV